MIVVLNIATANNTSTINKLLFQNRGYLSATYKNVLFSYTQLVNRFSLSSCAFTISRHLKNLGNCFTGNAFLKIKVYKEKSCLNVQPKILNKESTRKYSFHQFSRNPGKSILIWQDTPLKASWGDQFFVWCLCKTCKENLAKMSYPKSHTMSQKKHIVFISLNWSLETIF